MERPFFPTTPTRADALRWLSVSEKLLYSRDLFGCKSLATRARDADPTLTHADQILAVADTLIAGDRRVGDNKHDWYSILRVAPSRGRDADHQIAANYRNLGVLLNPQVNKYPYADQAFKFVVDAWAVLSNPRSKDSYDREIGLLVPTQQPDPFASSHQNPFQGMNHNQRFMSFGGAGGSSGVNFPGVDVNVDHRRVDPVGSSSQAATHSFGSFGSSNQVTQGLMNFGSGCMIGFGPGINTSGGTAYSQANDGYSSNFAVNANISNQELGKNPNLNGGADVGSTNGKSVINNRNLNSNGNANVSTSGHQNGAKTTNVEGNGRRVDVVEETNEDDDVESFWTACPYCYYMYEYPQIYVDCTLRCQHCKRAFQGVVISSPPPISDGQESYICCWGFLPVGFSMENWERNKGNIAPGVPSFIPMTEAKGVNKNARSWVYIDDDEATIVEASDASVSSGDDWDSRKEKTGNKSKKNVRGHKVSGAKPKGKKAKLGSKGKQKVVEEDEIVVEGETEEVGNKETAETSRKTASINARKQPARAAKNCGSLDLNVEFSNEAGDSSSKANQGENQRSNEGEDENIEGAGFFEGLDEFLNSLPILDVGDDDKAAKEP